MARKFSIADIMGEMRQEQVSRETKNSKDVQMVSIFDIKPNDDNFYELSEIEQLKNSIYAMGGVQQNLLLVSLAQSEYRYKLLAGHRRHRACRELYDEGHTEFEFVPAIIRENVDADMEQALLVMTNSTQRELTDWEKVMQHMQLKDIIPKLKKRKGLDGKVRELEADYLGVSEAQIAIYNTIGTRLNNVCMKKFKAGEIGISLAYEIAKADERVQKTIKNEVEIRPEHVTEEFIKNLINKQPMKGQIELKPEQIPVPEKVSESDTFQREAEPEQIPVPKKVSESDTFQGRAEPGQMPVPEKVSESDTLRKETESEHIPKTGKATDLTLLGGYDERTIDSQYAINKSYYEGSLKEHRYDMAYKYACICDGLALLKEHMNKIE